MRFLSLGGVLMVAAACAAVEPVAETTAAPAAADVTLGNGEANAIETEGLRRSGNALIVPSVTAAANSWLVLHAFKDGRPDGQTYVGATYVPKGTSEDVAVSVEAGISPGQPFLVMLHEDVDDDQVFDFVFVAENVVEDRAVFEGTTMIAHIITAP
ncbi:MAG: hypothetical protein AAGH41_00790 [Pseudomonadota bacterium]